MIYKGPVSNLFFVLIHFEKFQLRQGLREAAQLAPITPKTCRGSHPKSKICSRHKSRQCPAHPWRGGERRPRPPWDCSSRSLTARGSSVGGNRERALFRRRDDPPNSPLRYKESTSCLGDPLLNIKYQKI